ncbi:MAG: hypothetical protein ACLSB9_29915 [Hydrogeniiclostridium mannosilyticum]
MEKFKVALLQLCSTPDQAGNLEKGAELLSAGEGDGGGPGAVPGNVE